MQYILIPPNKLKFDILLSFMHDIALFYWCQCLKHIKAIDAGSVSKNSIVAYLDYNITPIVSGLITTVLLLSSLVRISPTIQQV